MQLELLGIEQTCFKAEAPPLLRHSITRSSAFLLETCCILNASQRPGVKHDLRALEVL